MDEAGDDFSVGIFRGGLVVEWPGDDRIFDIAPDSRQQIRFPLFDFEQDYFHGRLPLALLSACKHRKSTGHSLRQKRVYLRRVPVNIALRHFG
jgi:hypothetical protein